MTDTTDFRAALAHARDTEPSAAELDALRRALRHNPRRGPRRHAVALLVAAGLLIPASAIAAGPVSDAFESFLGITESTPVSVNLRGGTTIDQHDGVRFSVLRGAPDDVCLSLNSAVEICGNPRDGAWQDQLRDRAVVPVGTVAPDRDGDLVPLFVLTAPGVASVSVVYEVGPPTSRAVGNGGAVVLTDAARKPTAAIVYDRAGTELGRADISEKQWEWCRKVAGCPEMNR